MHAHRLTLSAPEPPWSRGLQGKPGPAPPWAGQPWWAPPACMPSGTGSQPGPQAPGLASNAGPKP
eukprot:8727481-Lingulodinium_polyedra.AAC.1